MPKSSCQILHSSMNIVYHMSPSLHLSNACCASAWRHLFACQIEVDRTPGRISSVGAQPKHMHHRKPETALTSSSMLPSFSDWNTQENTPAWPMAFAGQKQAPGTIKYLNLNDCTVNVSPGSRQRWNLSSALEASSWATWHRWLCWAPGNSIETWPAAIADVCLGSLSTVRTGQQVGFPKLFLVFAGSETVWPLVPPLARVPSRACGNHHQSGKCVSADSVHWNAAMLSSAEMISILFESADIKSIHCNGY